MYTSRFAALADALALTTTLVTGCKKDSDPSTPQTGAFAVELENGVGALPLNLSTERASKGVGQ